MANVYIKTVNGGEKTTPSGTDAIELDDGSTSKYALLSNLFKIIDGLTEDTTPDTAADFLVTYDTSASAPKKVKPSNLATNTSILLIQVFS